MQLLSHVIKKQHLCHCDIFSTIKNSSFSLGTFAQKVIIQMDNVMAGKARELLGAPFGRRPSLICSTNSVGHFKVWSHSLRGV
jgi:hypothetical protein